MNFNDYSVVHREMVNTCIVAAIKILNTHWSNKNLSIKCDSMAVVEVLTSGRTKKCYFGCLC